MGACKGVTDLVFGQINRHSLAQSLAYSFQIANRVVLLFSLISRKRALKSVNQGCLQFVEEGQSHCSCLRIGHFERAVLVLIGTVDLGHDVGKLTKLLLIDLFLLPVTPVEEHIFHTRVPVDVDYHCNLLHPI